MKILISFAVAWGTLGAVVLGQSPVNTEVNPRNSESSSSLSSSSSSSSGDALVVVPATPRADVTFGTVRSKRAALSNWQAGENAAPTLLLVGDSTWAEKQHSVSSTPTSLMDEPGCSAAEMSQKATTTRQLVADFGTSSYFPSSPQGTVSGEQRTWHRITLGFQGPTRSETEGSSSLFTNPFTDYRLDVTFTRGSSTYTVPGYFAADGNAANSGATSGNVWLCHFAPDEAGSPRLPRVGTWHKMVGAAPPLFLTRPRGRFGSGVPTKWVGIIEARVA
jgi:hypothetical protein